MQEYQLGDLLEKIVGGGTPSKRNSDYWDGEIPWASVKDMPDDRYKLKDTADHISKVGLKNSSSNLIPAGTVITSTRMGLGRCFINEVDMAINQDLKALFPKGSLDNKFLLWWLASKATELESIGTGTTVKGIRLDQLRALRVLLPSLQDQQKIASILSAFDDLIENNTRRIAILEEMARLIYREWFVHYRYPGHENDRLVDSGTELGEVPEGWGVAPFDDYLDVLSGGTPKTKIEEYWNGDIPFFTPKDATDLPFVLEADKSITQKGLQKCSSKLYEPYTVFITARGTVGKLNMPIYPLAMNQSCYALRAKQDSGLSQFFIYYALLEKVEALQKRAHGAVFDTIIKDTFKQLKGVFPNKELVEGFDNLVTPILKKIEILMVRNKKLKETRDLLLPKLISGKIEINSTTLN